MRSAGDAGFRRAGPGEIRIDPFERIGSGWMLVTAGPPESWNTMTASWGGLGHLWNRDVCFVFVRPQRHTRVFMDRSGLFTVSFFDGEYRPALEFCGSRSGRDCDKAAETGLVPFEPCGGCVAFEQARIVLAARKLYIHDLAVEGFLDEAPLSLYPSSDFHRMYIGGIEEALIRDGV